MSGFSTEWLSLREGADVRARNAAIAAAVDGHFALRKSVNVVDLGCGTGSNLRTTSALLPAHQSWLLVDHDSALLAAARRELAHWGGTASEPGEIDDGAPLHIEKNGKSIDIRFAALDLATDLDRALQGTVDLVTASALFDLVSEEFILTLARAIAQKRAAFYAVLTCNGQQRWSPHRPADNQMQGAFQRHQMTDKGFGPAAGPLAAGHLGDQFRLNGYLVQEGSSPWRLDRNDRMLIDEMVRGHAVAVAETGTVDLKTIEGWVKVQRSAAETGHTDTFAVPTSNVAF